MDDVIVPRGWAFMRPRALDLYTFTDAEGHVQSWCKETVVEAGGYKVLGVVCALCNSVDQK